MKLKRQKDLMKLKKKTFKAFISKDVHFTWFRPLKCIHWLPLLI